MSLKMAHEHASLYIYFNYWTYLLLASFSFLSVVTPLTYGTVEKLHMFTWDVNNFSWKRRKQWLPPCQHAEIFNSFFTSLSQSDSLNRNLWWVQTQMSAYGQSSFVLIHPCTFHHGLPRQAMMSPICWLQNQSKIISQNNTLFHWKYVEFLTNSQKPENVVESTNSEHFQ